MSESARESGAARMVASVALSKGLDPAAYQDVALSLEEAGRSIEGVTRSHVGVHFDFSVGGGDLTWDLSFEDDRACAAIESQVSAGASRVEAGSSVLPAMSVGSSSLVGQIETLTLGFPHEIAAGISRPGLIGVKRTLWLRVLSDAAGDEVARFEDEMPLLAEAIPAIRNWRWSRLPGLASTGGFTHLWEQEFESVDGLQVDYMSSPLHWGYIDRYFDPEMPEHLVDVALAHLACPQHAPILSALGTWRRSGGST